MCWRNSAVTISGQQNQIFQRLSVSRGSHNVTQFVKGKHDIQIIYGGNSSVCIHLKLPRVSYQKLKTSQQVTLHTCTRCSLSPVASWKVVSVRR